MKKQFNDPIVATTPLYQTTNYKQFKYLNGNRDVDRAHVEFLKRKIEKEGNLTQSFPIRVNENFETLDGQHTIIALEELKRPVFYEIKEGLNIESVICLNTGQKSWGWLDYATSWAKRGNPEYINFLKLHEDFPRLSFRTLYHYTANEKFAATKKAGGVMLFHTGEFVITNLELSKQLLSQYQDILRIANLNTMEFSMACYRFMRTPSYDHAKTLRGLHAYGSILNNCYVLNDFLFALEEISHK